MPKFVINQEPTDRPFLLCKSDSDPTSVGFALTDLRRHKCVNRALTVDTVAFFRLLNSGRYASAIVGP
ncbi:hypothetical protein O6P43_013750 [Quillaja saponaria]|uniref:Uncharacterized protein n=1 Tax=Quillaja saponaria TaxID=32244 RepID=A0AAD7LTL7_QUISA|nr:hypothetical protein O6P43_013750 [Quillaja saponaria]